MTDWHPDEGTLQAWAERQLSDTEMSRVDAHLASCEACASAAAEARGLIAASSRIVSALDLGTKAADVATPAFRARDVRRLRVPVRWLAAAGLLAAAGIGTYVARDQRFSTTMAVRDRGAVVDERVSPVATSAPQVAPAAANPSVESLAIPAPSRGATSRRMLNRTMQPDRPARATERQEAASDAAADLSVSRISERERGVAGAVAQSSAAPPAAPPPPPPAAPSRERRIGEGVMRLSEVVVTGVAAPGSPTAFLRATVYEVRPGATIELREYAVTPGGPQFARPLTPPVNEYVWHNAERTRRYVLTGPFTRQELESYARRLGELRIVR